MSAAPQPAPAIAAFRFRGRFLLTWNAILLVWAGLLWATGSAWWLLAVGLPLAAIYALFCLSAEHLCRAFPLRPAAAASAVTHQAGAAALLAAIWVLLARAAAWLLHFGVPHAPLRLLHSAALLWVAGVLIYAAAAALFYALQGVARAAAAEAEVEHARRLAGEAELRALRAQIHPHFLFNCLHSISALTASDPARARQMCIHLAELFRLTLRLGPQETITLQEELSVARAYLAVERLRFGARLGYAETIDPEALDCRLPALLLQPLVENAVKHGIASLTGPGRLQLSAARDGARLRLEVDNDYDSDCPAPQRNGVGLDNVRQRLAAHYGGHASLVWRADGGRFSAAIELPALAAAPAPAPV
ncbi:MAG: sensor histidine kinase [Terriglobales bacterium]